MANRRRKVIKLLLLLLIFSGIAPFVYPWGRPMLSFKNLSLSKLKEIEGKLPELPRLNSHNSQTVTVYRWRDEDGNWSYGSEPPRGVKAQPITVNPDANLIQGLPQAEGNEDGGEKNTPVVEIDGDNQSNKLMGYTAEDVSKIMQSAKEARTAMEQRYKQEEVIINEVSQ